MVTWLSWLLLLSDARVFCEDGHDDELEGLQNDILHWEA